MSIIVSLWVNEEYANDVFDILERIPEPDKSNPGIVSLIDQLNDSK